MKKPLFFKLLCVFSFVFCLFSVSTGFSDYIIDKTTYDENGTLSNNATSVNDNGEKVTITLKYQTIESKSAPDFAMFENYGSSNSPINIGTKYGPSTDSSEYDRLKFINDSTEWKGFSGSGVAKGIYLLWKTRNIF